MESAEQPEEDIMMDFESGIDTWIIDKDDSVSSFTSLDKSRRECKGEKSMNKENIKHSAPSSGSSSLRSFRIRKRVSYLEISSESESESIKRLDEDYICNKRRSNPSVFSEALTSCSTSNEIKREIENLSSEEISIMLSEIDDNKDISPGSNREMLQSIENVTSAVDNKTDSSATPELKLDITCSKCHTKSDCCNCGPNKTKLVHGSNRNRYKTVLKRNNSENGYTTTLNKIRDMPPSPSEIQLKVTCVGCDKSFEFCKCKVTTIETLDKRHKNKYEQLLTRNYLSNHKISPGPDNGKIIYVKKISDIKMKPAKPITGDDKKLICGTCGYLSSELLIYKSHQILFHSEKIELECEYCDFKTNQSARLATHIRVHFQMDCPYCDYHCSLKSSLRNHLLRYHENAHPFSCKTCNYSCKSQSKFDKHLHLHTVNKYQCGECKKFFSNKLSLKKHVKKHLLSNNVFKCAQCNIRFSQKQSLKLHMKCHENVNGTYVCSSCKVSFNKKYDFINHCKTHLKAPKTFKCEQCESTFSQGNHLKLHMRIHSAKYTKCQNCSFQCSDSSEIKNHTCVSVNKLYNVQKRSLNFDRVEKNLKSSQTKTGTNLKEVLKKGALSEKPSLTKSALRSSDCKSLNSKSDELKSKKTRPKVLAVRQNLRSFKTEKKNDRKNVKLQNKLNNPEEKRRRPKKPRDEKKLHLPIRPNGAYCANNSVNKAEITTRRQRRVVRKINKDQVTKGLELTSLLFSQKQTMKEISVEPVALASGSFIECYYQSQQPSSTVSLHQHEERHLRRPSLLSCRYCSYKTNSQQLLKWHVNEKHTWDPAVVSKLFRP